MTDCAYYPASNRLAVVNNTDKPQTTKIFLDNGEMNNVSLEPLDMKWFEL